MLEYVISNARYTCGNIYTLKNRAALKCRVANALNSVAKVYALESATSRKGYSTNGLDAVGDAYGFKICVIGERRVPYCRYTHRYNYAAGICVAVVECITVYLVILTVTA